MLSRLHYGWALVLAAPLLAPAPARADAIDDALRKITGAKEIPRDLQKHGYRTVGILRSQVQKGDAKPSFHVGYLNDLMATRLENALILVQPDEESKLLGVTHGASEIAAKADPKASYLTPEGRAQLFARKY